VISPSQRPLGPLSGFLWSHIQRHTVGLLWTSDQPVAETSRAPFRVSVITHKKTHGRTALDEWSARRRDLYLHRTTQHINTTNIHAPSGNYFFGQPKLLRPVGASEPCIVCRSVAHTISVCSKDTVWIRHSTIIGVVYKDLSFVFKINKKKSWHMFARSQVSSGSIVSYYGLDDRGSIPGGGKGFSL
jgi:hypothetical protein